MTDYERSILRELNGEKVEGLRWGAAMSEAIEWLHNQGYVRRLQKMSGVSYEITDEGRAAIAAQK